MLKLNTNKCKIAFYGRDINYDYKYHLSSTDLQRVEVIKDLGVVFDSQLSFVSHCKEKTRAHHGDEIPERDVTYHLTCLLIYH